MNRPLKIGILGSRGFPSTYGGFETLVRRLAPYLASQGHKVTVYCRDRNRRLRSHADSVGAINRRFTPGIDTKSLSTVTHGFTGTLDARGQAFDALIVLNVANGMYLPLAHRGRTKTIVNVDGLEWKRSKWSGFGRTVFKMGARATARYADVVVADSVSMQHVWRQLLHRETVFIPYGADVVGDRPIDRIERLGLRSRGYLLVVARLVPENNVDLIIRAHSAMDSPLPLVVVGSSNYEDATSQWLGQGIPNVRWMRHVSDQELLTDLWAHCALYLHGHSVGGTNPALLQALGAGSPVLALNTPFNAEVIESEEQLFELDVLDLADKMARRSQDAAWQTRVSVLGQRRVSDAYSWDEVCERYLELCQ